MKSLLLIPTLALALLASSCRVRTATPLDPMTLEPTARCLPHHFQQTTTHRQIEIRATK